MIAAHRSKSKPACIPGYRMVPAFSDATDRIRLVLGSLRAGECLVLVALLLPAQL